MALKMLARKLAVCVPVCRTTLVQRHACAPLLQCAGSKFGSIAAAAPLSQRISFSRSFAVSSTASSSSDELAAALEREIEYERKENPSPPVSFSQSPSGVDIAQTTARLTIYMNIVDTALHMSKNSPTCDMSCIDHAAGPCFRSLLQYLFLSRDYGHSLDCLSVGSLPILFLKNELCPHVLSPLTGRGPSACTLGVEGGSGR